MDIVLRHRGITLVELVCTLAVVGVALGFAIPAFRHVVAEARISAALHRLTVSLAIARNLAVSHRVPVTVCPSHDGVTCRQDPVWDQGWIAFPDPRRTRIPTSPDRILLHEPAIARGISIRGSTGRHWLRFQASGLGSGSNLALQLCTQPRQQEIGRIYVNQGGRIRSERSRKPVSCNPSADLAAECLTLSAEALQCPSPPE